MTISGEVNEVLTANALTIGGEEFLGTDDLLILGAEDLPQIVAGIDEEFITDEPELVGPNDVVQITGTVGQFEVNATEDEVGSDLDEDLFAQFEDEPFLIAEEIFLTPRVDRAAETLRTHVEDIMGNPADFVGATVIIEGAVVETLEPRVFAIVAPEAEGDETIGRDAVVVNGTERAPEPKLSELANVQVTGEVRELDVPTLEQDLGIDLDDDPYLPYTGTTAIVAESIQQSQGQDGGTTSGMTQQMQETTSQ